MLITNEIQICEDRIEIAHLNLYDPETVAYLSGLDADERVPTAIKAINLGIAVMQRVQAASDSDYIAKQVAGVVSQVEQRFSSLDNSMREMLEKHLDPTATDSFMSKAHRLIADQSASVGKQLTEVLHNTQENIAKETAKLEQGRLSLDSSLNPKNSDSYLSALIRMIELFEKNLASQFVETDSASFVGKLRQAISDHFGDDSAVLQMIETKLHVDAEGQTPLGQVFYGLKNEIAELRDAVMKNVAHQELLQSTTVKGFDFEDKVWDRLQEIARPLGDTVEDTSKQAEVSGSKKGDYLYHILKLQSSIVLDAKCFKRLTSLPAMLAYMEAAIRDRQAQFGIIIFPEKESLQKQIGEWNVYGNIVVTPLEHLETSVKFASHCLHLEKNDDQDINVAAVQHRLEEITRKMKEFSSIKGKLTKLNNGVGSTISEIQSSLDGIRESVMQKLGEIDSELR